MKKLRMFPLFLLILATLSESMGSFAAYASTGTAPASHTGSRQNQARIVQKTASYDPLSGLVAEDILGKFRTYKAVGSWRDTGDSVYDEALDLGAWVQYYYSPYFTNYIYALGNSIGQRYEWCFGTDVSNNFNENFAYFYGYYYALKNSYNNGESTAVYRALYRDYEDYMPFAASGFDSAAGSLYADLQELVTACNNLVRQV